MKSIPVMFIAFCFGALGLLVYDDLHGYSIFGAARSAAATRQFASHYHK